MLEEKTYIVHLYFRNSLHIGSSVSGVGIESTQEHVHSDTLWAAIANYWAILGSAGGVSFKEFLNGFCPAPEDSNQINHKPLFTISSAFPFTPQGRTTRYWFPKPLSVPFSFSKNNTVVSRAIEREKYGKTLKTVSFVSRESFASWQEFKFPVGTQIYLEKHDGTPHEDIRAHAAIDRVTNTANLYHSGIAYLKPNSERHGLYFLLKTKDERVEKALDAVFQVIRETGGIGGNISSGCGELRWHSIQEISDDDLGWSCLRKRENTNAYCLFSLYWHPEAVKVLGSFIAFNTVIRKGWTGSLATSLQKKRRTVHMLSEGSVLTSKVTGSIANVTPDILKTPEWKGQHAVFRFGHAFLVPIHVNPED